MAMSSYSSSGNSLFPVFTPALGDSTSGHLGHLRDVSSISNTNKSFKNARVSTIDEAIRSRRSTSESGYSDNGSSPSPAEQLKYVASNAIKDKIAEDRLCDNLQDLAVGTTGNSSSNMYSYQWDQSSLWGNSDNGFDRRVTRNRNLSLLDMVEMYQLPVDRAMPGYAPVDEMNPRVLVEETPLDDWIRSGLQRNQVNTFYNPHVSLPSLQASTPVTSNDVSKRLHVSNIPFRFREVHLFYMFEKFGEVVDAEIIYNDKGSKGFGFVTLSKEKDADRARIVLHGSTVEGRIVEVNLATPKMTPVSRPSCYAQPATWMTASPSPIVHGRTFSTPSSVSSPIAMLEAQTRLAEAQLAVLQMQQQMMYNQFGVKKNENTSQDGGQGGASRG